MPSGPGVFPFFNIFSVRLILAFEGGLSTGGSLLMISLKCSSHLNRKSASLFTVLPYLSFTGFKGFRLSPPVFLLCRIVPSDIFCMLPFQLVLLGH